MKFKIFANSNLLELEKEINGWLADRPKIKIKYTDTILTPSLVKEEPFHTAYTSVWYRKA